MNLIQVDVTEKHQIVFYFQLKNVEFRNYVRLINPKRKSDFVVRMWHDEHSKFKSPAELKIKLLDAFPSDIPSTENF